MIQAFLHRGSGRREDCPPAFSWVDPGHSCVVYEWVGSRENGIVQLIYDLSYQVRSGTRRYLGQMERNPRTGVWLVNNVQRSPVTGSEHSTWEEAAAFIWQQFRLQSA